jgi:hypothetical protein
MTCAGLGQVAYEDLLLVMDWRRRMPNEEDLNGNEHRLATEDENRVFGVPSIRTDRLPPARQPIDDTTVRDHGPASLPGPVALLGPVAHARSICSLAVFFAAAELR